MKILSVKDAAERLAISPAGVRALIRRGVLSAKMIGRDYLISEVELARLIAAREGRGRPKRDEK